MDAHATLIELQSVVQYVESVQARVAEIKKASSATGRRTDLLDDTEVSLMSAINKLRQLRIIAKADVEALITPPPMKR